MHLHILGIGGTFMGGIALLARAAGHQVTGSDRNLYPPMSTQLAQAGIAVTEGYDAAQLEPAPDVVVVGNVMTRGLPVVEAMLDRGLPYTSGPQWLAEHVLAHRWVLAVAGTHGKTTTASLLAWILEQTGAAPGFLIGGVPLDFGVSARFGAGELFVVEADEYDTAFFDKRSKFVHYRPRTLVLNNLEFDHADIFSDLAAIQTQFHHLVRTVPGSGRILANAADPALAEVLARGCWTPVEGFAARGEARWQAGERNADDSVFDVLLDGRRVARVDWRLLGEHNLMNALGAIAAAHHAGVAAERAAAALGRFGGVRRRLELRGSVNGITVYDDFAHHPTAIATTLAALRARVGDARLVAVLDPRSNTMRMGVHRDTLAPALAGADRVYVHRPDELDWDFGPLRSGLGARGALLASVEAVLERLVAELRPGDHVLIMSNGGFGGLHARLIAALQAQESPGAADSRGSHVDPRRQAQDPVPGEDR